MSLFLAAFTALFSVVNPLGAMPIFVGLTADWDGKHRNQQAIKAVIAMSGILVVFFLGGSYIMNFFGITLEVLRIAGGLIIIKSGFDLLRSKHEEGRGVTKKDREEFKQREDISFSPLAMPMLAGPGSIALLIGMAAESNGVLDYIWITVAILAVALVSFAILIVSPKVVKYLGKAGLTALSRMMGFIVLAIGIQYIANGVGPLLEKVFLTSM